MASDQRPEEERPEPGGCWEASAEGEGSISSRGSEGARPEDGVQWSLRAWII